MKKVKYIGASPKIVNRRPVKTDDIIEVPDNFFHRQFVELKKKPVIKKFNDLKIKPKSSRRKKQ